MPTTTTKKPTTPTYKLVINSSWLFGDSGSLGGNLLGIMICSIHSIVSIMQALGALLVFQCYVGCIMMNQMVKVA